jgi:thioredoxin-like negative regulator of GroEL
MGEAQDIDPQLKRVLRFCARTGNVKLARHCERMIGDVYHETHRYDEAVETFRQLVEKAHNNPEVWRHNITLNLAHSMIEAGQIVGARHLLKDVGAMRLRMSPLLNLNYQLIVSRMLIATGDTDTAQAQLSEVSSALDALDLPPQSWIRILFSSIESALV